METRQIYTSDHEKRASTVFIIHLKANPLSILKTKFSDIGKLFSVDNRTDVTGWKMKKLTTLQNYCKHCGRLCSMLYMKLSLQSDLQSFSLSLSVSSCQTYSVKTN